MKITMNCGCTMTTETNFVHNEVVVRGDNACGHHDQAYFDNLESEMPHALMSYEE